VTRRILLVLLAFTAAVLVGAVVPLTLDAASHDRTSFIAATAGMVRTDAAIAQSRLDALAQPGASASAGNGPADAPLVLLINQTQQAGDGLLIFRGGRGSNNRLVDKGMPSGNWIKLAEQADDQGLLARKANTPIQPVTQVTGSRVAAAMPVFLRGNHGGVVGTVVLARSTKSLNGDIVELWIVLGTIAALAMIAATLLAFSLARWVSRPLAGLDSAAGRLADGDLAIRAVVDSGPPELRRLATTFNTMAGRLEALVHGNRAVIADVSHQLRTPLAALRLRLDLLAADTDPATGHELAGALEELARLSRLVDGLLAVARAENVVPVPTAVDVAEVARERVVAWHPVADDRGITLEVSEEGRAGGDGGREPPVRGRGGWGPRPPVQAWIGEGHLEQVLDNLIANALEALSAGCHVTVTATTTVAGAQITVADDGPGLPALHHVQPERHRAGPGHRPSPGHLERRHGPAGRDAGRRADRDPGLPGRASDRRRRSGLLLVRAGPGQLLGLGPDRAGPGPGRCGTRAGLRPCMKAPKIAGGNPRCMSGKPGTPS
jgi:signal transduction histidine kinase